MLNLIEATSLDKCLFHDPLDWLQFCGQRLARFVSSLHLFQRKSKLLIKELKEIATWSKKKKKKKCRRSMRGVQKGKEKKKKIRLWYLGEKSISSTRGSNFISSLTERRVVLAFIVKRRYFRFCFYFPPVGPSSSYESFLFKIFSLLYRKRNIYSVKIIFFLRQTNFIRPYNIYHYRRSTIKSL